MEVTRPEEVGVDARIARDRCLEAMIECENVRDRRALWKAAAKYNRRMRDEASAAQVIAGSPLAQTQTEGSFKSREIKG